MALLGFVTLAFVAAIFVLDPPWPSLAAGFLPSLPQDQPIHYFFLAVSMSGATIAPYLLCFYPSGAVEDDWDESYLGPNGMIAGVGMSFGGVIAIVPLLILMNDPDYLGKYRNGKLANTVVIVVIVLAFVMAIVSIPLELLGG